MSHGRVMQIGPPEELYRDPKSRFVARFFGNAIPVDGTFDGTRLITAGGTLVLPREVANCDVFVRAEDVNISDNGPLSGRVESATFLGTHYRMGNFRHCLGDNLRGPCRQFVPQVGEASGFRSSSSPSGTMQSE